MDVKTKENKIEEMVAMEVEKAGESQPYGC